jgi:prolipoprotein diacylglyceryltransferase
MNKPSWQTSTLSQVFLGGTAFYGVIISIVAVGLVFFNSDVEKAKLVIGWASALQVAVMSAYLTARQGVNGKGGDLKQSPSDGAASGGVS